MTRFAKICWLAGVASCCGVAGLLAWPRHGLAQALDEPAPRARSSGLRTGTPQYVAQQRAPENAEIGAGPVSAAPEAISDPAALVQRQQGTISQRQPPRAARPVQSPALRGVTQRQFRAPQPVVTGLPPVPAAAPPPPRRRGPEEDPYAPLGIRLGAVTLRPAISESIGYDTNPSRVPGPSKGSAFSRTEGELGIQSNWNVHELAGSLRGGYSHYFRDDSASRPDAQGNMSLRLDATRDTRILLESRLVLDTQRPGSPDLTAAVKGRPITWAYGGSAGVTHDINRLQLTLRGSIDRQDYENAELTNGRTLSQADRNQTQYSLRLRAAYEVTPGFRPFLQAEVDTRQFDEKVDSSGYMRSSDGYTARLGSTFEISRMLTGEISAGYQDRKYEDARLKNLRGMVGDAAILWTPTPLTTVTLRGTAELGDTTIAGSSGTTARRVSLEIAHALRRNLTVTGFTTFQRTDYEGQGLREDLSTIGARLDYRLTRTFSVRASFTHERLNSTQPGSDYTANVSLVGLRMQF
ncbi:outer membrane beta-barrel protein [Bosea sp. WAO]|uniref:outer membrane beta-barrel protein n=1 Tax=Bosea sp. WAO TaxID=406341 RepID=UPI000830CBB1|nr:outer membrane beta-barrel protein [Bosea sp. WAO]